MRPGSNLDLVFRLPPCKEDSKDKPVPYYSVAYDGSIDVQGVVPDPVSWLPPLDLPLYISPKQLKVILYKMAENLG